jgi:hypothetical protein
LGPPDFLPFATSFDPLTLLRLPLSSPLHLSSDLVFHATVVIPVLFLGHLLARLFVSDKSEDCSGDYVSEQAFQICLASSRADD